MSPYRTAPEQRILKESIRKYLDELTPKQIAFGMDIYSDLRTRGDTEVLYLSTTVGNRTLEYGLEGALQNPIYTKMVVASRVPLFTEEEMNDYLHSLPGRANSPFRVWGDSPKRVTRAELKTNRVVANCRVEVIENLAEFFPSEENQLVNEFAISVYPDLTAAEKAFPGFYYDTLNFDPETRTYECWQ